MMIIKELHSRRKGVQIVIARVALLNVRAVYIKATEKSLTMSGTTGEVVLRMSQLAWYLVMRTGFGNHLGIK
jgi:hypothetical protein